jgi:hypothetical protein
VPEDPAGEGENADDPVVGDAPVWIVWRQDDNGNRFEVARFEVRVDADTLAAVMQARGHKQIYWVATAE